MIIPKIFDKKFRQALTCAPSPLRLDVDRFLVLCMSLQLTTKRPFITKKNSPLVFFLLFLNILTLYDISYHRQILKGLLDQHFLLETDPFDGKSLTCSNLEYVSIQYLFICCPSSRHEDNVEGGEPTYGHTEQTYDTHDTHTDTG